jgi:hypothetical protein
MELNMKLPRKSNSWKPLHLMTSTINEKELQEQHRIKILNQLHKVKISKELLQRATSIGKKQFDIHERNRITTPVFHTSNPEQDEIKGILGELMVCQYATENNIEFVYNPIYDGRGDKVDITVEGEQCAIKTAKMSKLLDETNWASWNFLVERTQLDKEMRNQIDQIISVQISKNWKVAFIMGMITPDEVKDSPIRTDIIKPAYAVQYDWLRDVLGLREC